MYSIQCELARLSLLGLMDSMGKRQQALEQCSLIDMQTEITSIRLDRATTNNQSAFQHMLEMRQSLLREIRHLFSITATKNFHIAERQAVRISYLSDPESRASYPEHIHAQIGEEVHNFVVHGMDPEDQHIDEEHWDVLNEHLHGDDSDDEANHNKGLHSFLHFDRCNRGN